MKVYVVTMHRWGCCDTHSYVLAVVEKKAKAQKMASAEEENRGGKYVSRITETDTQGVEMKVIKEIEPVEGFDCF